MNKFYIKTLGCKTNQIESAAISELLINEGFFEVNSVIDADFYILNSCSVTHIADNKNLSYLRRAKRENPLIKTVLTGCMAQLEKEKLIEQNIADFVVGNYEKNDIANIIKNNIKYNVSDIFLHKKFRYYKINKIHRTRAFVKIQDGCNNRCSYCTIPFARGNNRSDTIENIINQINLFAANDYFEVVLTGIHIGQWGLDFKEKNSLKNLLEQIENSNIHRYRLGSLNPTELSDEFIDFLSSSNKFCPHFHLSLQSCCDRTLKMMNRKYNVEQIFNLVDYINKKFTSAYIGSDIIAGFATETDEDFEITRENLQKLDLTRMHIFPYSRRKGTLADTFLNQPSEQDKKLRCSILQKISDNKLSNFLNNSINSINEVIIEKNRDKKTNLLKGVTKNYINVLIDNDNEDKKDTIQNIRIIKKINNEDKMLAEII